MGLMRNVGADNIFGDEARKLSPKPDSMRMRKRGLIRLSSAIRTPALDSPGVRLDEDCQSNTF